MFTRPGFGWDEMQWLQARYVMYTEWSGDDDFDDTDDGKGKKDAASYFF